MDCVLSPVLVNEFIAQYWESDLLHINRTSQSSVDHFAPLLTVAQIEAYLAEKDARFPDIQVVDSGRAIPMAEYTDNNKRIIPKHLMRFHEEGATIIISQAHNKFDALKSLCHGVNKTFQMRCQANVYLSPAGNQGFQSHYDTHDVFILQVSGSKTFRFFSSEIELPFPDDAYHPDNNAGGEALSEANLTAGDTLYIPRGKVHDALADESAPSLHITLGVFPFVVRDLLQQMVQVAAEKNVQYRRSAIKPTGVAIALSEIQSQIEGLQSEEIYSEALSRLNDEVAMESVAVDGIATEHNADEHAEPPMPQVDSDSTLTVIESSVINVERRGVHLKLRLIGQVIQFTNPMSTAVDALLNNNSMRLGALPGLDDEQRRALCTHLLNAGAVTISKD